MKTIHRSYGEDPGDFNRLARFIVANYPHVRSHSTWCLGRFVDWKYGLWGDKLSTPGFWEKNAHLWFDSFGELAGFAISENGGADFAVITAEGYRFLFEEVLGWVLEYWGHRGPELEIEIAARQTLEAGILERHGFRRAASFYTFRYDLADLPPRRYSLEEGFAIVDMAERPDYRAQHVLRQNAFQGKRDISEEKLVSLLKLYDYARQSPIYHPQTDLCVMAPDGSYVAGCEALIDARNAEVDIERVCTHSDYRRRGLARAVVGACMNRLREMGMRRAYIGGYSPGAIALYASLDPQEKREALIYKRVEG